MNWCFGFCQQHNMTHYLMVAKLSKRCSDLVVKIPQHINRKVTQGDFIHLYNKSEEEQHKILRIYWTTVLHSKMLNEKGKSL